MVAYGETKHGIGGYTLKNGDKRYRVVYRVGPKVQVKSGFHSIGEAKAWQRHTLVALDKGEHIESKRATETFGAYVERWLVKVAADPAIRQNTWSSYESNYRIHLKPTFANVEFRHLDTEAVRTWHTKMKGKKKQRAKDATEILTQATCAKVYRLMRRICGEAMEDGYLRHNPCRIKKASAEPESAWDPRRLHTLEARMESWDRAIRHRVTGPRSIRRRSGTRRS